MSECELGELAYLALPAVFLTCLIGPRERRMGSYLSHRWRLEPKQLYLWRCAVCDRAEEDVVVCSNAISHTWWSVIAKRCLLSSSQHPDCFFLGGGVGELHGGRGKKRALRQIQRCKTRWRSVSALVLNETESRYYFFSPSPPTVPFHLSSPLPPQHFLCFAFHCARVNWLRRAKAG